MSKRGYISRYLLIVKKLKAKPYSSYEELLEYIEQQSDHLYLRDESLEIGFSKRTLQRDLKEIRNLFGIDIEYSKRDGGYFIADSEMEQMNFERMMEAFDMFNVLNLSKDTAPYVRLEKRRPQGMDNFHGLLHAIKNRLEIRFAYQKFWEEKPAIRSTEPYALKEFKSRWYVLAKNKKDGIVKCFALDRLSALEISNKKFTIPAGYDADEQYRYSFGIISPTGTSPQEIILSFDPEQGKYIKTLPLHDTQQVLIDNKDELQIKLKLHITHDLLMELLSYGDNVTVVQPASLAKEIREAHRRAFEQYG